MKYTMLDGEEEFLAMLLDDPHDETNRLVYADWLESMGDLRAEWLRLEVQFHPVARMTFHHRFRPVRKRLRALAPRIDAEWCLAVTRDHDAITGPLFRSWPFPPPRTPPPFIALADPADPTSPPSGILARLRAYLRPRTRE